MSKTQTISIDTTKRGFAAMWESGGGMTSGGSATIITGRNGEARRPIYMPRGGHLACGNHALIGVGDGFYIVTASVRRGSRDSATIKRIVSTSVKDIEGEKWSATAEVEVVNTFSRGEWDSPLDEKLESAVEAAFRKASSYHCRSAYYIDTSPREEMSEAEKKKRQEEMARQDAEREAKRKAKAEREAREKAEREAASKSAKEAGLGARLEAANARLTALGRETVELGDVSFKWGWQSQLYTEENVARIERQIEQMEREAAEKERKRQVREQFQPQFETFQQRVEALGLSLGFSDDYARLSKDGYGTGESFPYSDDGLVRFGEHLERLEAEAIEKRRQVEALAEYNKAKAEAAELGLPQNVEIWTRTGGRTNAGNGWVIGPDGQDRDPTSMWNHNPRRLQRYGEGYMVWEQILPGEVVLQWSKATSAAPHEFEVIHLPAEGLTEAQLERIREIQDELEADWEGARGLASGEPSPPVGEGWGLLPQSSPDPSGGQYTLDDLQRKFNGR
jgi:hypothetical protein